ncbi:MAG: FliH/SctL family protein [Terracidiphilus sp.]|jgi:flagellar assembly protein FliH
MEIDLRQAGLGSGGNGAGRLEKFEYPASPGAPVLPDWNDWGGTGPMGTAFDAAHEAARDGAGGTMEAGARMEFEKRLAEETRRSFEAGRERGRLEGRQAEREAHAAAHDGAEKQRLRQAAELIGDFARERDRYLRAVESEVVELALAVAARILRREAQMDPLLLTGAVRVALGQLSSSTEVRLRVPAAELELWTEAIALLPNLALKPVVEAGEEMRLGDCAIESEVGSVDLGIRSQLGEIERGFFDRAPGQRPEPRSPAGEQAGALKAARP